MTRAQDWQPIATAPKDGSYVLVANSHGSWVAKWLPVYVSGYRPSNPWASMMLNHDHIEKPGRFDMPTHWQNLPPPPSGAAPGDCPRCKMWSRGAEQCGDCRAEELDALLTVSGVCGHEGTHYLVACREQREAEAEVIARAEKVSLATPPHSAEES